jgi:Secretion system C-terminal sorting domain
MKKIITLIILFTNLIGNAQCPAPSNLTYNYINPQDVQLSWTENGTANTWDITVVPNFYVGAPLPSDSYYVTSSNSFILVNFPPTGCNVFFVRSRCSATVVSPWVALATSGCNTNVYNYLATLSNNNFSINNDKSIKIFPNPSSTIFKIVSDTKVNKITLFDALGKEILIQSQNNSEVNVEKLSKGIYLIEIISENEKIYRKFIKD